MYIETVILNNYILTFCAVYTAARVTCKRCAFWRMHLACVIGTVAAVFYPFLRVPNAALIFIKIALGLLLCVILFIKTNRFIASSVYFFGFTFLLGGSCFALGFMIYGNYYGALAFSEHFPLFIVLLSGFAAYFVCALFLRIIKNRDIVSPYLYKGVLTIFGEELDIIGFLDTGNKVFDPISGSPVVICSLAELIKRLKPACVSNLLYGLQHARRMSIKTAGAKAEIILLNPDNFRLYLSSKKNRIVEVTVGLLPSGGFDCNYDMILNPILVQ